VKTILCTSLLFSILFGAACSSEPGQPIPDIPQFDEDVYYAYALTAVDEVLDRDPDNAEALGQRAELLLRQGKTNQALACIRQAIDFDANEPRYRLTYARVLLLKGKNRDAFREAQRAVSRSGPSVSLYEILAEASLRSNYYEDAILYSDSAIAWSPYNAQNYLRKGQAAARIRNAAVAEPTLLKARALGADRTEVYSALISMYVETEEYPRARRYLKKMLSEGPVDNQVRLQQARILRMTGRSDSSRVILNRLRADSTLNRTLVNQELMELHYQDRRYDSAIYYAQRVLVQQPEDKAVMLVAARSHDSNRAYQPAIRQYEAILELDSLQQADLHREAVEELDKLRRKVTYLWKRKQEEEFEKLKRLTPIQRIAPEGTIIQETEQEP
jgi:predicted Zn-dependent protease